MAKSSDSNDKQWKFVIAPGAFDGIPDEQRGSFDSMIEHMKAMVELGGPEMLQSDSRQVVLVKMPDARCVVCKGVLTLEEGWDEYECTATTLCRRYTYIDEHSEIGQRIVSATDKLPKKEGDDA